MDSRLAAAGIIASIIIGVVGTLATIKAVKIDYQIAEQSGVFERGIMLLQIANLAVRAPDLRVAISSPAHKESTDKGFFYLPVQLTNIGDRTIDDATVTFQFHKVHGLSLGDSDGTFASSNQQGRRVYAEVDRWEFVTYELGDVNPRQKVQLFEPLWLEETGFTDSVTVTTADRLPLQIDYRLRYALNFRVVASARDLHPVGYDISLEVYPAEDIEGLAAEVIETIESNCEALERRGFWKSILGPTPVLNMKHHLLLHPEWKYHVLSGGESLGEATPSPIEARSLSYPDRGDFILITSANGQPRARPLTCASRKPAAAR